MNVVASYYEEGKHLLGFICYESKFNRINARGIRKEAEELLKKEFGKDYKVYEIFKGE